MPPRRLVAVALLSSFVAIGAHAQIEPQRPLPHGTLGLYQPAASWGWERVGSWGWERVGPSGSWGWERVGSWGWERTASSSGDELVGLVFVEETTLGGATQHWAYFDNYDARQPTALRSAHYDYPDLRAFLDDAQALSRAYVPVTAGNGECADEPTCVTLTDVDDALIRDSEPDRNFGASQSLTVSRGSAGERRALLRFDTSAIPATAYVQSAELALTGLLYGGDADVTAVMAPWDEASVTWNVFERTGEAFGVRTGRGAHTFRVLANVPYTAAGKTTSTSLGALVQTWVDGIVPNHGVVLDPRQSEALVVFASSESPSAAQRPSLTVCYRACAMACAETCAAGSVCAAGRCREADEPFADVCGDETER